MPERGRPPETREMRLVSRLIEEERHARMGSDATLAEFIARRRHPDAGPLSWDQISYQLADVIGEIVTDGTLRKWAAILGVPNAGRGVTLTKAEYERGLKAAKIVLT